MNDDDGPPAPHYERGELEWFDFARRINPGITWEQSCEVLAKLEAESEERKRQKALQ